MNLRIQVKPAFHRHRMGAAYRATPARMAVHSKMGAQGAAGETRRTVDPRHSVEEVEPHKLDSSSPSEIIRLAQQGDASAFELIYKLHCRRVYALCLRLLRDPVEAEDLTQEAFMQLFRKIHTFRGESAFSSWLYRLTTNTVFMHFRKKKLLSTSLDDNTATDEEDRAPRNEIGVPDLRLTGLFDRVNLQKAVDQLPEGCRTVFLLHDVQDHNHHEIAEILGCSVGNSKSQLHKARRRLRKILQAAQYYGGRQNREVASQPLTAAGGLPSTIVPLEAA